jgi:hypothetical protein
MAKPSLKNNKTGRFTMSFRTLSTGIQPLPKLCYFTGGQQSVRVISVLIKTEIKK